MQSSQLLHRPRPFVAAAKPARDCSRRASAPVCAAVPDKATPLVEKVQGVLRNCLLGAAAAALVAAGDVAAPEQFAPRAEAGMLSADPVKNAKALLRYALPIDNAPIRRVQKDLESISEALRIPGNKALGSVSRSIRSATATLDREANSITAAFAPEHAADGKAALEKLKTGLVEFKALVDGEDKQEVPIKQQEVLGYVGLVEEAMVKGFPFQVPSAYANLPQLKGRATVEMKINFAETRENGSRGGVMTIVADGYNAPVSAGDFVDLVSKGFYNGMEIQRSDGFVVQTGKPDGDSQGYEVGGAVRRIPFEVMVEGDKVPVYEETLEDNGRFNEQPRLPFNAFGTMALAREEFDANSGSSQFFWLLKESELTPTGSNLLDGRYAVFGYVTDNSDLLKNMQVGDKIEYAKVIDGAENLVAPDAK